MSESNDPVDPWQGDIEASPEAAAAFRAGLRQAGYHVMRAGYELLAGVSAFLEAVGGAHPEEERAVKTQRIEVE